MYDYYSVLEKLSNNSGVKPPNRYHAFLRMVHEYSHLLMLKRAGRGHDKLGVFRTKQGELAVKCPSCPRPGENLPDGWEDAPPADKFLYIIFLAIDACFRLKRRLVSSELKGPMLGSGWSYMVETKPYRQFMLSVTDQKERIGGAQSPNTKFSRSYSATGVGMGVCVQHEFVQANGVADLQRGERFVNMDWLLVCILLHIDPRLFKMISYDIVCQWWINLKERLTKLPSPMRLTLVLALIRFVIPKMHIRGHLWACMMLFSLNYVPGSAQTDGKGIERPWAHIGGVGTSTREMGPGSREDTLNAHWGSWNWQKLLGLDWIAHGTSIASGAGPAVEGMIEKFEADPKAKNPYDVVKKGAPIVGSELAS
ncbi:hypothetical protein K438DRAFT_1993757 [Mycena galopus ATCC 62051]|nr:hypothetical protein K438DRAFT_1993757 [Mycena galopus ATCC 62051]